MTRKKQPLYWKTWMTPHPKDPNPCCLALKFWKQSLFHPAFLFSLQHCDFAVCKISLQIIFAKKLKRAGFLSWRCFWPVSYAKIYTLTQHHGCARLSFIPENLTDLCGRSVTFCVKTLIFAIRGWGFLHRKIVWKVPCCYAFWDSIQHR